MTRLDEHAMQSVDTDDELADAELAEHHEATDLDDERADTFARGLQAHIDAACEALRLAESLARPIFNPQGVIIAVEIGRPGSQNVLTIREARRLYFGELPAILSRAPHDDPELPPDGEQLALG